MVLAACDATPRESASTQRTKTTPTSTTTAPTTTTTPMTPYQVRRGDTLTSIAKFFGISTAAIIQANQLSNADRLTEGQILQIPPTPPPQIVVTPSDGIAGDTFKFTLSGAKAGETVTFAIHSPDGGTFTGSPHTASQEGVVSATYISTGDAPGTYTVVASGDRGTTLETTYRLLG